MEVNKQKIEIKSIVSGKRKQIAWGITGGGHFLKESIEKIFDLLKNGFNVDIFFSRAAKEVCKMFGEMSKLIKMKKKYPNPMKLIFAEDQGWSFPICGSFSLKVYEILIVSPTTANSIAKISYKIADSLITNIVSQSLKGKTPIIIIPTDYKVGTCDTFAPGNKKITIELHESDIERTVSVSKIKGITVLESPSDILI